MAFGKRKNIVPYLISLGIIVSVGAEIAAWQLSNIYFHGVAIGSAIMWVTGLTAYIVTKN